MKWVLTLLFLLVTYYTVPVEAEYRVFLLQISKKSTPSASPATEASPDTRLVESTLDPLQYHYYYPLAADENVISLATWRCRGRTDDFKPFCPNPKTPPAKDQFPGAEAPRP